tara:strand:+ start:234 stop:1115 length:882 start_codon:yes stop_codon:yes gene_type:complete
MQLMKPELIDTLCQLRAEMLEAFRHQIIFMRKCHSLCQRIDDMIPSSPAANYDYFDIIFIRFRQVLGDNARQTFSRDNDLMRKSEDELVAMFTKIVDEELWRICFNRLNIFSLMSSKMKEEFNKQNKAKTLSFTVDNVEATFLSLLSGREAMMIESLLDCVIKADKSYASNTGVSFGKRIVFDKQLFRANNVYWMPSSRSVFHDFISFYCRVVMGEGTIKANNGEVHDVSIWKEIHDFFTIEKIEKLERDEIEFTGGKAIFFNNGNIHVTLEEDTVAFLNAKLGESNTLPIAS